MTPKILLVDDEPNVTKAMKQNLRREKYEILCAGSAKEAWDLLQRDPVDVMVVDEQMPGMVGSELLVKVRREYPAIIRIILTGHATQEGAVRAVNEGQIYRFLEKPCNALDLVITLRRALQHKEMIAKSGALLTASRQQSVMLQTLESRHPDIAQQLKEGATSASGDTPHGELDLLLRSIDVEVKKIAEFFGGTVESSVVPDKESQTGSEETHREIIPTKSWTAG